MATTAQKRDSRWERSRIAQAIASGTQAERLARLHAIGLLDDQGELTDKYKNWGERPSRTPEDAQDDQVSEE